MDPTERLAADVQELKKRFDEMSLRFAISEEREKRVDDKIDNMVAMMTAKLNVLEQSVKGWNTTGRWVLTVFGGVFIVALGRWAISGQLAGF